MFSYAILGQAVLWAVITAAVCIVVRLVIARQLMRSGAIAIVFASSFFINLMFTYFATPAHVGAMHGVWWNLLVLFLTVGTVHGLEMFKADSQRYRNSDSGTASGDLSPKTAILLGSVALFVLLLLPLGQLFIHQWPLGDSRAWAEQPNITVASPDSKLPQTDNQHIVLVDREVALFLAQSKLGDQNIGSKYKLEKSDFVKQSLNGHLYWVCPLEYKSEMTQMWDALFGNQSFPGFVIVDAENPDPNRVELIHNLDLHYTNGAMFGHNVIRHLYAAGYTDGNLENPTIELDDSKQPFITVTYSRPKFTVGGDEMVFVLVVDMKTGGIQEYQPDQLPAWIDRVVSEEMALEYANNWGKFNDSSTGWLTSSFNGGANQMKAYHLYMAYNSVDSPVYHIAMTSNDDTNHSSTGVLVYETRSQKGTFYPGLSGLNLDNGATLKSIAENSNGAGNKDASEIGLFNVDGQPTWIAIYTAPQQIGRSFAGLGMMDAKNPASGSVAFGNDKTVSLRKYETYLASGNPNGAQVKNDEHVETVTGTVVKANWVNGKLYVVLAGDSKHRFAATQDIAGGADLVEVVVGEKITLSYKDFGARQVEVTEVKYNPAQK